MKLNYRDRVILGALLAIVILIVGFVFLVKPKNKEIKENKATLTELEKKRDETKALIAEIPGIKDDITAAYNDAIKLTDDFVKKDDINTARKLDQFMQKYAEENEVKVTTLNVTDLNAGAVAYYYFTPAFVAEDQLVQADINGKEQKKNNELRAESNSLSARTVETVLSAAYNVTFEGEKENFWNYMEALEKQDKTIIINSVSLTGIEIKEEDNKPADDEEEIKPTAQMTISLYSIYKMDTPNLEME